jgi:hypothetical protein
MRKLADEVFVRTVLHGPEELIGAVGSLLYTPGNPPLSIPAPEDGLFGKLVNAEFRRRRARVARLLEGDVDAQLALLMAAQEPMAVALTRVTMCAAGGGYSRAVAEETLRRHPPALASLRELTEPLRVHGHDLPPGTVVMVPLPLIEAKPFGGGERSCLGEQLAWAELDAIVPIALETGLRPLGSERMVLRGTILVPQRSGLVRA